LKPLVSKIVEWQEDRSAAKFSYICAATPFIRDRFLNVNKNTIDINNYPIIDNSITQIEFSKREKSILYIGGISDIRGIYELISSLSISKLKLHLAGDFKDEEFKNNCMKLDGWQYVEYHGYLSRNEIKKLLEKSRIGIVTLYPLINYLDSLPVKMFEYMYAGIPVICSDFEYWKSIVEDNNVGLTINPKDSKAIAVECMRLMEDEKTAQKMGFNGHEAVIEKYNWTNEELKLKEMYKHLV